MTVKNYPLKSCIVPCGDQPGVFGFIRKHDVHTGIDLYTFEGAEVFAIEDGVVVKVDIFTGPKIGMDWWNETWAVMVEGDSGVINYGEIKPNCVVGQQIKSGDLVGNVIPVLPPDKIRADIFGHSCSMLHIELYQHGHREFANWELGKLIPDGLLDPMELLK
jgi:hypothetical protein